MKAPTIENAPGLKWRRTKAGWEARWRARTDIIKAGYKIKLARLWSSTPEKPEPSEFDCTFIAERCQSLQAEMLLWSHDGVQEVAVYDETWGGLTRCYRTDPDSPYHKKEWATRRHYDTLCRRIDADIGGIKIYDTDARKLLRIHENWIRPDEPGKPEKISMGHAMIGMMRTIATFGGTLLKCKHCREIRSDLKDMRVKNGKPREVHLNADQVLAIRAEAHHRSEHSIALAQACQFDIASGMRQKDIIGEWIPLSEPGVSDVIDGQEKWVKGLRWEEIDEHLVMHHVTNKRKKLLVADLTLAQMVMEEFRLLAGLPDGAPLERRHLPASGPIIVNEKTTVPWHAQSFRLEWRDIKRACRIPDEIKNMDTRSGAITEAFEAQADAEDIRKGATHATLSMTNRYSRGDGPAADRVTTKRAGHRKNKSGTGQP